MLYKLISGLHSSISIHIASDYLLDEKTNMVCFSFVPFECNTFSLSIIYFMKFLFKIM